MTIQISGPIILNFVLKTKEIISPLKLVVWDPLSDSMNYTSEKGNGICNNLLLPNEVSGAQKRRSHGNLMGALHDHQLLNTNFEKPDENKGPVIANISEGIHIV